MLGTIVNVCAIAAGSTIGSLCGSKIQEKYHEALFTAMGLAALGLGMNAICGNMPQSRYPVLFLVSLALGSVLGTWLDLNGRFQALADRLNVGGLSKGLTTGILLFCIGTLSILGPIRSALYGDNTYLFTNATLDFVSSMVLASTYGFGMILVAVVLFCWQGSIYLLALWLGNFMTLEMMTELSIVGGFLITASGLGVLGIKDCKTMNMLPSLVIPPLFCYLADFF